MEVEFTFLSFLHLVAELLQALTTLPSGNEIHAHWRRGWVSESRPCLVTTVTQPKADACLTTYLSILYILLRNPQEYIFGVSVITLERIVRYETHKHSIFVCTYFTFLSSNYVIAKCS